MYRQKNPGNRSDAAYSSNRSSSFSHFRIRQVFWCVLSLLLSLSGTITSNAETIFFDDFHDVTASGNIWTPDPGLPGHYEFLTGADNGFVLSPTEGSTMNSSTQRIMAASAKLPPSLDISVRGRISKMQPQPGGSGNIGFALNDFIIQGAINPKGSILIRAGNGNDDLEKLPEFLDFDVSQEDVMIRLDAHQYENKVDVKFWAWPADSNMPIEPILTISESPFVGNFETIHVWGNSARSGDVNEFSSSIFKYVQVFSKVGDFNSDGQVNGSDFLAWQRGESPNPSSASDLADWEANFGAAASLSANSIQVPEPATGIMLLIGMVTLLTNNRTAVSKLIR